MIPAAVLSLAAAAHPSIYQRDQCNQDDCLRDIQGTHAGLLPITQRQSDCSSFMGGVTVTAAPSTTTLTLSVWETQSDCGPVPPPPTPTPPAGPSGPKKRQDTAIPTNPKPTYATWCQNNLQYFSACSCWNISPSTTTASASIATSTVTVTLTQDGCDC